MRISIAFLLAATGMLAADYPQPVGHVNDFAGALAEADRQALESRLRAYEQSTSIEVAVAIVPSLQGRTVEDYSRELFQAWGIGKRDRNNGVLFLWAPAERRVRIQVGYGLESVLTEDATLEILRDVTGLFRRQEFAAGVNAGVEGILNRLDHSGSDSAIPVAALVAGLAALIGIVAVMQFRRHKRTELIRTLPQTLEACSRQVEQAERAHPEALKHLEALRQESPEEVWRAFEAALAGAPSKLAGLRQDLAKIPSHPRQQYRELREVERAVRKWQAALAKVTADFVNIETTLASVRDSRRAAQELLIKLPGSIANSIGGDSRLIEAAQQTYEKARAASASTPVNWLLVYDLLLDAEDCVARARGEEPQSRSRVERRWAGSDVDSPAMLMMAAMFPVVTDSGSSSAIDTGSSSGGSDFGGFGGGDTGSGGASGSY